MSAAEEIAELLAEELDTIDEAPATERIVITEPGVYESIPHQTYHDDPVPGGSLSHSGARKLMPPSTPARFAWERDHPTAPTESMEWGSYAHAVVLGVGQELVVVDAKDWTRKADQTTRRDARAAGMVPLLAHQHDQVLEMAAAIEAHPGAMQLLKPPGAANEASLFWLDKPTGTMLRARLDVLPKTAPGRMLVADYKTADHADDEAFGKSVMNFGYHSQAAWTLDGIKALDLADSAEFLFVVQERRPPYLVNLVALNELDLRIGRKLNRDAINLYAHCVRDGHWPGYSPEISYVSTPGWYQNRYEDLG